ncbi:MAG: DUF2232 domain-containing protein [Bacillota bacterium]|nr:DUF2232 domain-containing protein [Bacillota bacterium]
MEIKDKEKYSQLLRLLAWALFIGFLGFSFAPVLIMFIYPGLFMEASIKSGLKESILVMFVTSLVLSMFSSLMSGLALFFIFAPMVLIFHYGVINGKSYIFIYFTVLLVLVLSMTAFQLGLLRVQPLDLSATMDSLMSAQVDMMKEGLTALEVSQLQQSIKRIYDISLMVMPSLYVIILGIIVYINYTSVGRKLLSKGVLIPQPPFFGYLQMPRGLIVAFAVGIFIPLMLKNLQSDLYMPIYFNVLLVFGFLFFVNGMAVLTNLLVRIKLARFLRMLFLLLAVVVAPVAAVVAIVGLIDTLVQFRKIKIVRGE